MSVRRVLVVDDDDELRMLARRFLGSIDIDLTIEEAADGLDAIDVARRTQPDLILLDIAMPRLDGVEALPLLREAAPTAMIVMVTAFTHWRTVALDRGVDGFIEKPYTRDELAGLLRTPPA